MREKHKMLTFYLQSCFFCHTESKNVATTLICATGSHTKKIMACWLHSSYSNNFIGEKKNKKQKKRQKMRNDKLNKKNSFSKILKAQTQKLHTSPKVLTREYIKRVGGSTEKLWNAECWAA